jgi:hypothetical protein
MSKMWTDLLARSPLERNQKKTSKSKRELECDLRKQQLKSTKP